MKFISILYIFLSLSICAIGAESPIAVRVMTDGFNCKEGIIIADQVREIVQVDTLLRSFNMADSTYIIVEITSYQDGGTAVINAGFATVSPIQKSELEYKYTRRLVSKTLVDMKKISANIIEKVHLIRKN
jgi:hypothetical protein